MFFTKIQTSIICEVVKGIHLIKVNKITFFTYFIGHRPGKRIKNGPSEAAGLYCTKQLYCFNYLFPGFMRKSKHNECRSVKIKLVGAFKGTDYVFISHWPFENIFPDPFASTLQPELNNHTSRVFQHFCPFVIKCSDMRIGDKWNFHCLLILFTKFL